MITRHPLPMPRLSRALLSIAALASITLGAPASRAADQQMPRNMKIVVPFAPGASTDLQGRAAASAIMAKFGNSVIVENRPGAGSLVGTAAVAKAPKDGSNMLLASNAFAITAGVQPDLPFDSVNDFSPVAILMTGPLIMAVPVGSPYKTAADVIAAARAKPGSLNYGSPGIGSSAHINGELFNSFAKTQMVHVAYKGVAPALTDMLAGRVDFIITSNSSLAGLLAAGKIRPIALTSVDTNPAWPGVPSLSSTLPGYRFDNWFGLITTGGTPQPVVDYLNREIRAITATESFMKFIQQERSRPSQLSAPEFTKLVHDEIAQWKRVAVERGIKPE